MNHLAHFHLAGDSDTLLVGALLADYHRGLLCGDLATGIEQGVRLHRSIDAFTDSHPAQKELRRLFPNGERRLAGVVLDMYFDHILATHWRRFHADSLWDFSQRVYLTMHDHAGALPAPAQAYLAHMSAQNLLWRYTELSVIKGALRHIGARLRQDSYMARASEQASQHLETIQQVFLDFYPQAMELAESLRFGRVAENAGDSRNPLNESPETT